jgi:hypothetical protein
MKIVDIQNNMSQNPFNMTGYTKLFGSIVDSTIWRESKETKIVWITMLAKANRDGIVEASLPGLADASRVSIDECVAALECLSSPDKYSRTKEFEGRRIESVDGGWRILNHAKYRAKMNADERREYFRLKKQEQRSPKNVHKSPTLSKVVTNVTEAEAEAEAEAYTEEEKKGDACFLNLLPDSLKTDKFKVCWCEWLEERKKTGKKVTERAAVLQLKKLSEFGHEGAIRSINQSIEAGWRGLFEPKEKSSGGRKTERYSMVPEKMQNSGNL